MGVILRYPPCFRDFVNGVRRESLYKPTALLKTPFLCHMVYGHLCQCWKITAPGWHLPSMKHREESPPSVWYFVDEPYRAPSPPLVAPPSHGATSDTQRPTPTKASAAEPPLDSVTPFMMPLMVKKKKVCIQRHTAPFVWCVCPHYNSPTLFHLSRSQHRKHKRHYHSSHASSSGGASSTAADESSSRVPDDEGAVLGNENEGTNVSASVAAGEEMTPVEEETPPQRHAESANEDDATKTPDKVSSEEYDSRVSPEPASLEAVPQPPSNGHTDVVSEGLASILPPLADERRECAGEGGIGNRSDEMGLQASTLSTTRDMTALPSAEGHHSAAANAAPMPGDLEQTNILADEVQAADSSDTSAVHQASSPISPAKPSPAAYTDTPTARPKSVSHDGDMAVAPAEQHESEESDSERCAAASPLPTSISVPSGDLETAVMESFRSSQPPTPMGSAPGLRFSLIVADPVTGPSSPPPLAAECPVFEAATAADQSPPEDADGAVGGPDFQTQEPMAVGGDTANPAEISLPSSAEQAARMTHDILTALAPRPEDVPQEEEEVWENQRRLPLSFEFSSAFLRPYERGPFSTKDGNTLPSPDQVPGAESSDFPLRISSFLHFSWSVPLPLDRLSPRHNGSGRAYGRLTEIWSRPTRMVGSTPRRG